MSRHKPIHRVRSVAPPHVTVACRDCGAAASVEVCALPPKGKQRGSSDVFTFYCVAHYVPDALSDAMRLDLCKCVIASRRTPPDANGLALKTGRALERRALVERAGPHCVIGGWVPTAVGRALVDGWENSKTLGLQNAALFDKRFAQKGDLR